MPLSPFPPAPIPGSESFEVDAGKVLDAIPTLVDELNALQSDVSQKQADTSDAASAAALSKNAAVDSAAAAALSKTAAADSAAAAAISRNEASNAAGASATSAANAADSATLAADSDMSALESKNAAASSASGAANNATSAAASATSAASSATTATTKAAEATSAASAATAASAAINVTANVSAWSQSTAYAVGTVVYSSVNWQNYRRKVAGTTATDPSQDATNWEGVGFGPADIGSAPNQVPLNQFLGSMAYQSHPSVYIEGGVIQGQIRRRAPVIKTAAFTVADNEHWLICNGTASIAVTLPDAALNSGREIMLTNRAAFTVVSASSNVVPLAGGAAGTAILAATAGKCATLVSDGTNWIITQAN